MARSGRIAFGLIDDSSGRKLNRKQTKTANNMNKDNPSQRTDRKLGIDRNIPRRDFLNGAAMTIGATLLPATLSPGRKKIDEPQNQPGYNPPISTGLRGSHPGSFEIAHSLRDGTFWKDAAAPAQLTEKHDRLLWEGESAAWLQRISIASAQAKARRFLFWKIMMISAVTPSAMNFS
jgi:hypothetical protein